MVERVADEVAVDFLLGLGVGVIADNCEDEAEVRGCGDRLYHLGIWKGDILDYF